MNSTKCCICDNAYAKGDVKGKDHFHVHVTGKDRGLAYRDCNIKVKLNHKILMVFHNLRNYDSHLIMQEVV